MKKMRFKPLERHTRISVEEGKNSAKGQAWCLTSVIPATQEEIGKIMVQGCSLKDARHYLENN
jgi:hypothetical protein